MEEYKRKFTWFSLIVCIFLIGGAVLCYFSWREYDRYLQMEPNGVDLIAKVSRIKETWDADDGTEYDVYIQYEYGSSTYEKYHVTTAKKTAYSLGEEVKVRVNPDDPNEIVSDVASAATAMGVVGSLILGLASMYPRGLQIKPLVERPYAHVLCLKAADRRLWRLPLIMGGTLLAALYASIVTIIIASILIFFGLWLFIRMCRTLKKYRNGEYEIRVLPIVEHKIVMDDGTPTYRLILETNGKRFTRGVNSKFYELAVQQGSVRCIYLQDNRPAYCIDPSTNGLW